MLFMSRLLERRLDIMGFQNEKVHTSVFSTMVGRVLFKNFRHECNCLGMGVY